MLKLIKTLITGEPQEDFSSENTSIQPTSPDSVESIIAKADDLWKNGKLGEALVLYRQAIQQNPESTKIYEHISALLKQQGDIAKAYEKLATELKEQGKIEQAASYYRQAIGIKTLTGDTREKILKQNFAKAKNNFSSAIDLRDSAFSFQPLAKTSALVLKKTQNYSFSPQARDTKSPADFASSPLSNVSQEQAKNVKWEAAQVYLQQALEYCEQKKWQEAALTAQKAIAVDPELAEAYKIKGNALQRMGDTAEAMKCYIKALEIKPNLAEVYGGIGDVYAKQQQWKAAIEYYQKAIIIKPSANLYRNLAHVLTQIGELEEAKINAYKASQLESGQTSTSSHVEQTPSALNSAIETVEPSKNNTKIETYRKIAQQLEGQNRWQEATVYYRQALKLCMSCPESKQLPPAQNLTLISPSVNKNLSAIKSTENQIDKAIKRYQKQAVGNPKSVKVLTDLGNLYSRKRQWQAAIDCYRQAIEINPKYAQAHLNLARVFAKLGKESEFIEHMEAALALKPNIASATDRFNLGNALSKQEKQDLAIRSYYKAIVLDPHLHQAYYRLGEILNEQEKHQHAVEIYQKAVEYNPEESNFYYLLGQQLESLKQWDKAVKAYSKVLELKPRFRPASQKLNHALAEKLRLDLEAKRK